MNRVIEWMKQGEGTVRYSIGSRLGPDTFDSASAVYFALRSCGMLPNDAMGTCDDLRTDLLKHGWERVESPNVGDVFIWGVPGASEDGSGHSGIMVDEDTIIHCNKEKGISIDYLLDFWEAMGKPPQEFYHSAVVAPPVGLGGLDRLAASNGTIEASGWYRGASDELSLVKADTGKTIDTVKLEDEDFHVVFETNEDGAMYLMAGGLIFPQMASKAPFVDPMISPSAKRPDDFYFEIIRQGAVVKRGRSIIGELSWTNELMYVPKASFTIPIEFAEYFGAREEVRVFVNSKVFHGFVSGTKTNKVDETIRVDLSHIIHEWQYRQIPTNIAIKNRSVSQIYSMASFVYPGWNINYLQSAATESIDYVYSRQNKLAALTKTCELTSDLFWRVGFTYGRTLDIGSFGEVSPYVISKLPSGRSNIRLIREPEIRHEFDRVINTAVVYGEKGDSGMSSMSLREIYNDPASQLPGFPVVVWNPSVNNERRYFYTDMIKLAPNNTKEYAVIDNASLMAENGVNIEGTFSFNDLAPFSTDGSTLKDVDRVRASKTAYNSAVRRLKLSRRRDVIQIDTEQIPNDLQVGNRIRFLYDNAVHLLKDCGVEMKEVKFETT